MAYDLMRGHRCQKPGRHQWRSQVVINANHFTHSSLPECCWCPPDLLCISRTPRKTSPGVLLETTNSAHTLLCFHSPLQRDRTDKTHDNCRVSWIPKHQHWQVHGPVTIRATFSTSSIGSNWTYICVWSASRWCTLCAFTNSFSSRIINRSR